MLFCHGEELIPGRKPARNKLSQLLITNRCGGGGWVKPQTPLMPEVRLGGGQPRDKAKVQACVRIVERWLLGRLRNRIFYSLVEINAAIGERLADLNDKRVLRQFGKTRRQMFEDIDVPNLKPLPPEPWVHAEWKRCRVGLDYHIACRQHHYSVPFRYARREVEVRITARTVEIFLGSERIAVHMRGSGNGRHTTIAEHMPASHRRYGDWTPAKIREEAGRIGPMMSLLVEKIIENRPHPEQGYRSCLGIIGLEKRFGADRLEAAALRALEVQARNYPSIKSILEKGLDRVPVPTSLMIGGLSILMPMPATICSKFSKIAMGCAQLWSPARSR